MSFPNRLLPVLAAGLALGSLRSSAMPSPAVVQVDVITFDVRDQDEKRRLVVTLSPTLMRLDKSDDGLSVIYDPKSEHYTGLEHHNATWWEFSWPAVEAAVETSKRYESHLRDLTVAGLNDYQQSPPPETNTAASAAPAAATDASDDSGYVWRTTTDKKRIAGYDCVRWTGETVSGGEAVEAWCYAGLLPPVKTALAQLRVINEPMALVPVRPVLPPFVFVVCDALVKGGVTPLLITWGANEKEKSSFAFVETKTRTVNAAFFAVPPIYLKTTLVTMDGILDEKK